MTCAVYRHLDADGDLLYVGVTNNPKRRIAEHKCRAVWADQFETVAVKWYKTRDEAIAVEAATIAEEGPTFNGGLRTYEKTGDAFTDWMAASGENQTTISEAHGISQATLSRMVTGKSRVPLLFAANIETYSKGAVPMRYWVKGATAAPSKSQGRVLRLVAS